MTKVGVVLLQDEKPHEKVGQIEIEVVPRTGNIIAFDEPGQGTGLPVGTFEVVWVKHYYPWQYPQKSEVVIFVDEAPTAETKAHQRSQKPDQGER